MRNYISLGTVDLVLKVTVALLSCEVIWGASGTRFTNCGGFLNASKGVIQSPNFPNPFPTPILCEWVIKAPLDKKVMIYFTQYYLRGHFHVFEYDYYKDPGTPYAGEKKLATVKYEENIWGVAGHKQYVVLRFSVQEMGNIHMRVLDHFMDVYGFNITYEFVDKQSNITKNTCYVQSCSFLGNCIATADFSVYQCECFKDYFGDMCQFGPHCDPLNNINMCENGGKCRYFYGTYVNYCECAEGFYGTKCEETGDIMSERCKILDCEQTCINDKCSCWEGFRLNNDNRTCKHIERYRVTVSIHPTADFISSWMTSSVDMLVKGIEERMYVDLFTKLWNQGLDTMDKFGILGFSNTTTGIEFKFFFYFEKYETSKLGPILEGTMTTGSIGPVDLADRYVHYLLEPELHVARVTSWIKGKDVYPIIQGNDLTLSCEARGSKNLKFRWFKDNAPFEPQLSTRDAFQSRIPSTTEETIRSVMRIDKVSPFDKGKFTCEASDYGEVQNKSISIDVITFPLVDLDPLSTSVRQGANVTVRCMSPDDTQNKFQYEWFENGYTIPNGKNGKRVEDLKPTGIRLFVRNMQQGSVFTCRVTNKAGSVNVTAHVYVWPANATSSFCEKSYVADVEWRRTGGGHFDKQRCPAEPTETGEILQTDFSKYGTRDNGYTTRTCYCDNGATHCSWNRPNFANCQSLVLVQIYDQFEMLRLGYQLASIKSIYDELNQFVAKRKNSLYAGDVEMAASLLYELLNLMRNVPSLVKRDEKISVVSIVNVLDLMLSETSEASIEELRILHAGKTFIRTVDLLAGGLTSFLDFDIRVPIFTNLIELNVKEISVGMDGSFPTQQPEISTRRGTHGMIGTRGTRETLSDIHGPMAVMDVRYATLESLLKQKAMRTSMRTNLAISDIHSIYPYPADRYIGRNLHTEITIFHRNQSDIKINNKTICLAWQFDESQQDKGTWSTDSCIVVRTSIQSTVCRCRIPGHFLVVALEKNITILPVLDAKTSNILVLAGSIIMLCGIAATLSIYLLKWRQLIGGEYVINLNMLLSLLALTFVFLACLYKPDLFIICYICQILTYFFLLSSFAFLFAESVFFFFNAYSEKRAYIGTYKYLLIGWGIPFVLTLFFVMASEVFGKSKECLMLCWLTRADWQFYGFLIPVTLFVIVRLFILMITSLRMCTTSTEDWRFSKRRKLALRYGKSLSLLILLLCISILSMDLADGDKLEIVILLFIFKTLIALCVFVHKGILDRQLLIVFWKMNTKKYRKRDSGISCDEKPANNAFRTFIKPEKIEVERTSKEQQSVNKYYDEVDRLKFTKERKRQLSSLLGSSSVATNLSVVSAAYLRRDRHGDLNGADSGIYVGSENDKYLTNLSLDSTPSASMSNNKTSFLAQANVHSNISRQYEGSAMFDMPTYTDSVDEGFSPEMYPLQNLNNRKTTAASAYADENSSAGEEVFRLLSSDQSDVEEDI
ncbi:uncharacterized protein LOC117326583 [Pecten maximus]|uniref:uncharacterized protein LOC117326583 n=1 Tax=Pecten maximus TaxID=6579 RepID=UPI0014581719|nr:uncharacterized protein LOC117326583 [Pecten maximus]